MAFTPYCFANNWGHFAGICFSIGQLQWMWHSIQQFYPTFTCQKYMQESVITLILMGVILLPSNYSRSVAWLPSNYPVVSVWNWEVCRRLWYTMHCNTNKVNSAPSVLFHKSTEVAVTLKMKFEMHSPRVNANTLIGAAILFSGHLYIWATLLQDHNKTGTFLYCVLGTNRHTKGSSQESLFLMNSTPIWDEC